MRRQEMMNCLNLIQTRLNELDNQEKDVKNSVRTMIEFLGTKGYEIQDLTFSSPKEIRNLYNREKRLDGQLGLHRDDMEVDDIFEEDTITLKAA